MYKEPQQSITLVSRPILESISMNFLFRLGQGDCPFRPQSTSPKQPRNVNCWKPIVNYLWRILSIPRPLLGTTLPYIWKRWKKMSTENDRRASLTRKTFEPTWKKVNFDHSRTRNGRRVDSKFQFVSRFLSLASMRMPWWSEDSFENWLCC